MQYQDVAALNSPLFTNKQVAKEPLPDDLHLNTMLDNKQSLALVRSQLIEYIKEYIDAQIKKISPTWIESLQYYERNNKLLVSIKLAARPLPGEVPKFQQEFLNIAGAHVDFAYSAGKALQSNKIQTTLPANQKSELFEKIRATLPTDMQVTNLWLYYPKVSKKSHPILICQIISDERQDALLRAWQLKFEIDNNIDILIKRDWAKPALVRMLSNFIGHAQELVTDKDLAAIQKVRKHFFGSNKKIDTRPCEPYLNEINLHDLTADEFNWVKVDEPKVQDREDLFCAKRLTTGEIEVYIGITDPSEHVKPHSHAENYASKIGMSIYGRGAKLSTLPGSIPYYDASFIPGKERRAIVLRYTLDEDGQKVIGPPKFIWAKVISRGNIPPSIVPNILQGELSAGNMISMLAFGSHYEDAIKVRGSLFLLTECITALKNQIKGRALETGNISLRRIRGSGIGNELVMQTMIAFKAELAKFLHESGITFIARNQQYPDEKYIQEISKILKDKNVALIGNEFTNPFSFKELLQYLDRQKEYVLVNEIISKFLLRTTLSTQSTGFQALEIPHYMNIKPRDYDGLINNMLTVAYLAGNEAPFTIKEIEKRMKIARKRMRQSDSMGYLFRVLKAVERHLMDVGQIYSAEKIGTENGHTTIKVAGFGHTSVLLNQTDTATNQEGKQFLVRFLGLDYKKLNAYVFELVEKA